MIPKLLPILTYPDKHLRQHAEDVLEFNDELKQLSMDMQYTMQLNNGIGLAATQCGINKRVIVVIFNGNSLIMVNPKILSQEGEFTFEEGCLSVPGYFENVMRSREICVEYQDTEGVYNQKIAFDIDAVCMQHEIEHLDGILFVDHLSKFKQQRALQKVKKTLRSRSFALESKSNGV